MCSESFVSAEVDRYYNMGVRHIFPIHNFDNSFGGSATWQDVIEVGNRAIDKHWWSTRECAGEGYSFGLGALTQAMIGLFKFGDEISVTEAANYLTTRNDTASCNQFGLFPLGQFLVNKLMDKGMIIDLDHMSALAYSDAMDIAESRNYPAMVASHVQLFDLNQGGANGNRHERMRTLSQLNRIKNVGGMIATMPEALPPVIAP